MSDQETTNKPATNGRSIVIPNRKGKARQWKELDTDPLAEGYDTHPAQYVVGKGSVSWSNVEVGKLFSRSKTGKSLWVKMNAGKAINLDTRQQIEVKPSLRNSLQVWVVTSFNSTTANQADF